MALTPEDVVNKRFNPTKFREGYDQDEVDDFLDEVVVELRRLGQENEELRQRLVASDARISELQRSGAAAEPASAPAEQPVQAYTAPPVEPSDTSNTNNLLQLARRLHEEHVREGIERRDALILEGQNAAAKIVAEAESGQEERIAQLLAERESVESEIDSLRAFESEYRASLRGYIEGQLRELTESESVGDSSAASGPTGGDAPREEYPPTSAASASSGAAGSPRQQAPYTGFVGGA